MAGGPRSLREAQRWLAGVILAGDAEAAGPGPLASPPRGTIADRLHAHVDGYPARVREALAETFPAVAHLAGDAAFDALTRRYLPHVPAGGYGLGDVGGVLPDVLRDDPLGAELPFLADLARLEWAVHRAFHAHLASPFDPRVAAGWTPDDWAAARVRFQPGTVCIASPWPIRTLWEARRTPREEIDVVIEGRPEKGLVHRVEHRVACTPVEDAEAVVLARLLGGATLGEAVAGLAAEDAERVGGWTASWAARGLVVACERRG
jgi:hypothetical protein